MSHGRIDNRYLVVATILGLAAIGAFTTMAMTIGEDFAIPALIALACVVVAMGVVSIFMRGAERQPAWYKLLIPLAGVAGVAASTVLGPGTPS